MGLAVWSVEWYTYTALTLGSLAYRDGKNEEVAPVPGSTVVNSRVVDRNFF
jgi:hypothetical protein